MKKNYFFKFLLFLIPVSAFVLMSNSGGRENALTGSPGDSGQTCSQCHSGGSFGASVAITTNIPASGYDLNTEYDITVTATSTAPKHGFQITAEKISDNSKVGIFTADANAKTKTFNSNKNLTHTIASTSLNEKAWTFKWTSPSSDQSQVKFYASAIAADGTGGTGGDQVVTTSTSVGSLSIKEANRLDFSMYPNPSSEEMVTIQLPTGTLKADVSLYDISGRLIKTQKITNNNNKVSVQNLSNGIYMFKVAADGKLGAQQFVKK